MIGCPECKCNHVYTTSFRGCSFKSFQNHTFARERETAALNDSDSDSSPDTDLGLEIS